MLTETEVKHEILEDTLAVIQSMQRREKNVFVFETIPGIASWSVWSVPNRLTECTDDWDNLYQYDIDGIMNDHDCCHYDALGRVQDNRLFYGIRTQWTYAGNSPYSEESLTDSGIINRLYEILIADFHAYEGWVQQQMLPVD